MQTWPVSSTLAGVFVRYLRLMQTGVNSNKHHYLALSGLEIHGQLAKVPQGVKSVAYRVHGSLFLASL